MNSVITPPPITPAFIKRKPFALPPDVSLSDEVQRARDRGDTREEVFAVACKKFPEQMQPYLSARLEAGFSNENFS